MKLEFDAGKIIGLKNVFAGEGYEKLKRSLFTILLRQKDNLFKGQVNPDGEAWQPLSPKTIAKRKMKGKGAKILQDTGALKNSLTSAGAPYAIGSTEGNEVSLGTNIPYAAIQNFGGTILKANDVSEKHFKVYKSGKNIGKHHFASKKEIEMGDKRNYSIVKKSIITHAVGTYITIPARPFMGFGKNDDDKVTEKIEDYMAKGAR